MYDRTLLWLILGLVAIGFIMILSTSMPIGFILKNDPFLFIKRNILYLILAFFLSKFTLRLPSMFWKHYSVIMLIISIIMLFIVLTIGRPINGASRWIILGPLSFQPAELTKLSLFCYLSNYLTRKKDKISKSIRVSLKPMSIVLVLSILLSRQPDIGTVIILFITALMMLFLAGIKIWQFISFIGIGITILILLIFIEPYRIRRITSFWNPWKEPFGSGYQLTQSLVAFGRGELFGQGLGNSVQKLSFLPEAHTDFIFSIIGEELGYIGATSVLFMIFFVALRAMFIGRKALKINNHFSGFLAVSIGIWFVLQTLINVGATVGILPIKGSTLPLISYGGSSLLITLIANMILLRVDYETRLIKYQAFKRR